MYFIPNGREVKFVKPLHRTLFIRQFMSGFSSSNLKRHSIQFLEDFLSPNSQNWLVLLFYLTSNPIPFCIKIVLLIRSFSALYYFSFIGYHTRTQFIVSETGVVFFEYLEYSGCVFVDYVHHCHRLTVCCMEYQNEGLSRCCKNHLRYWRHYFHCEAATDILS